MTTGAFAGDVMPKDLSFDVKLEATDGKPVVLPSGESATSAQFMRDGMDLYLKSPEGHTIKVEGYFAHNPAPDLVDAGGTRLPHQMVDAFLLPQHPGEYAAAGTPAVNDASAVGKITQVVGDATVTRPDGSHVKADVGLAIHEGDVIETSAKGAVHILFADNTTFAISESARLAIDQYVYNPQENSGTSFFSMLQGVFVYTSGLIGKDDPSDVKIDTPVGSIGIRGTIVAGDINPAGEPSTITVVDGAIVVTNGGGTIVMSDSLDTVTLTSYDTAPVDSGTMTADSFDTTYSAVAPADPSFYSLTGDSTTTTTSPDSTTTTPDSTTPATTSPDGTTTITPPDDMTFKSPDGTVTTADAAATSTTDTTVQVTDAWDPTVADPTLALTDSTLMMPVSDTSFTTGTSTFGATTTSPTTFTDTTTAGTGTSTGGTLPAGTTSGTTTTPTTTTTTTAGGTGTGTGGTAPPAPVINFMFSGPYLNGTPGTGDDGIPLFAPVLGAMTGHFGWTGTSISLGTMTYANFASAPTFTLTSALGTNVTTSAGTQSIYGNTLQYDMATTGNTYDTQVIAGASPMLQFNQTTGALTLNMADIYTLMPSIQPGGSFDFTVTASDGLNTASTNFSVLFQSPTNIMFQGPAGSAPVNVFIGDSLTGGAGISPPGSPAPDTMFFTGGDNLLWGRAGDDTLYAGGGDNVIFGDLGNDSLGWIDAAGGRTRMYGGDGDDTMVMPLNNFLGDGFSLVDGGTHNTSGDTLQIGGFANPGQLFNFETSNNVFNIENIEITGASVGLNVVQLSFNDIFEMTANNGTHDLKILNSTGPVHGSNVIIDGQFSELTGPLTVTGSLTGAGTVSLSGTLISNGQTVTLIIDKGNGLAGDGIAVTVN